MAALPGAGTVAARFFVQGRVQGVGFRASARHQATALKLSGFARNLADGRVETWVQGTSDAVDAFESWLHHGPPFARVEAVRREPAPIDLDVKGFGLG